MRDDFVISVHALERFHERFPELWTTDEEVARLIHAECETALLEGRSGYHAPLELASYNTSQWKNGRGLIVWEPTKMRGYVLEDHLEDGMLVVTVLQGTTLDQSREKLRQYDARRKK